MKVTRHYEIYTTGGNTTKMYSEEQLMHRVMNHRSKFHTEYEKAKEGDLNAIKWLLSSYEFISDLSIDLLK